MEKPGGAGMAPSPASEPFDDPPELVTHKKKQDSTMILRSVPTFQSSADLGLVRHQVKAQETLMDIQRSLCTTRS